MTRKFQSRERVSLIDYWFWFRQHILKYGANAQILSPQNLVDAINKDYEEIQKKFALEKNSNLHRVDTV